MKPENVRIVDRVSNFGTEIVVEFSDGVTAHFDTAFLYDSREQGKNGLIEEKDLPRRLPPGAKH